MIILSKVLVAKVTINENSFKRNVLVNNYFTNTDELQEYTDFFALENTAKTNV